MSDKITPAPPPPVKMVTRFPRGNLFGWKIFAALAKSIRSDESSASIIPACLQKDLKIA
ncbi:MAG: hypothetical protein ACTSRW_01370 [Candidatus Helarchaeota archaeon]